MEFFTKTKVVKLRSHLDKYLIAVEEEGTVRQIRKGGSSRRARWFVELDEDRKDMIHLKSCNGHYLTASARPFLLGMTGNKVTLTSPDKVTASDMKLQWQPIRDGFQIKLKTWCGTLLRGNGGTPPWRNTVTHDEPYTGATQKWVLWDVEAVEEVDLVADYLSSLSSFNSSVPDDLLDAASDEYYYEDGSELGSPISVVKTPRLTVVKSMSPRLYPSPKNKINSFLSNKNLIEQQQQQKQKQIRGSGMDFFKNAKAVRLRSHHDKYLTAEEDEESVTQDRNGSSKNAKWFVELVPGSDSIIRLKSCYNKYLTASNQPFLLGMTGRKVLQTVPGRGRLDSSVEWEPVREGQQVKLKTRYGNYLRANGGLPPWRNSVTHDIPHRTATQDWVLWGVNVVEIQLRPHEVVDDVHADDDIDVDAAFSSGEFEEKKPGISHLDSLDFDSSSTPSSVKSSTRFSRQESSDSNVGSPPKSEGRTIYYHVADESGEVNEDVMEGYSLSFKGKGVEELTQKLREETGLQDIVVCTRSPLNGKLYPLLLQLPPNNADMHVVVVQSSSKAASSVTTL